MKHNQAMDGIGFILFWIGIILGVTGNLILGTILVLIALYLGAKSFTKD